jgi:hypothetical protein
MFASGAHATPTISRSSSLMSIITTPSRRPSFVADGCQTSSSSLDSPRQPTGFTLDKHRSARDLWMDKGSFWEKLEVTDQTSSLGNSAERRMHQLKVSCYTQSCRFQSPSTCRDPERLQSPVITRGERQREKVSEREREAPAIMGASSVVRGRRWPSTSSTARRPSWWCRCCAASSCCSRM